MERAMADWENPSNKNAKNPQNRYYSKGCLWS